MPESFSQPNLIDRVIGALSPEWGARRQMWRDFQASYSGGISTRLNTPWSVSTSFKYGTQADRASLGNMRDRARAVYRENPIGRSLIDTETDNVIAEGMTLQAKTGDEDFDDEAEERWADWIERVDVRGVMSCGQFQRMVWSRSRVDGDVGVVLMETGPGSSNSRLQIIPGDLIRTPDGKQADPSIIDGIEVDQASQPTGFHILDVDERGKRKFSRVGARNFIYLPHISEPLQVRGETAYSTVFELLTQLLGYIDGVATAARMATIFGLIFKKPDALKEFQALGSLTNSQGVSQKAITLENGMVKYVGKEGEVAQVQATQPMQQTPDFVRIMLRLIGLPFSMPLELVLRDVSQANLSSLRGGRQDYHRACRPRQDWFRVRFLSRAYRWWISRAIANDEFSKAPPIDEQGNPTFWGHEFKPRGWELTDKVSEVQGTLLEIDAGLNSPQNACAELNRDYDEIQEQREEANKDREKRGLPDVRSTYTREPMTAVQTTGETANAETE